MCAAAAVIDADPLLYGPDVTGEQYQALAAAEVIDAREVAAYARAGLTIEQTGAMARAPAGACLAGVELGIPSDQWATVFAGWHRTWATLPERYEDPTGWSPVAKGLIGAGWPVDALTALARAGWGDMSATHARVGLHAGTAAGRSGDPLRLTHESAVAAARAGLTTRQVTAFYGAFTTGGRSTPRFLPYGVGLLDNVRHDSELTVLDVMVDLDRRGVKPAHLTEFRQCGCASIADVFTALDTGITAADAKRLRIAHGTMTFPDSTRRFKDVSALIEAYTVNQDRNA